MRLFALLLPGLAAAAPSPLSARQSPIDISGAYWNTHLIGAHGYLAYHLESMIAVLNNPKFAQIVARTCISSRVPQPIIPPTNPELVTKHCDDGLTYDRQSEFEYPGLLPEIPSTPLRIVVCLREKSGADSV